MSTRQRVAVQTLGQDEIARLAREHLGSKTFFGHPGRCRGAARIQHGQPQNYPAQAGRVDRGDEAGEFVNTGEPIIVSDADILNDGQHRLAAVVESSITVEMDVRFGVPRAYHAKTDKGASRTP